MATPLDPDLIHRRLAWPEGRVDAVFDTDAYNEIDDQFALVHALLAPERIALEAVYAAPFHNKRSTGPADGMRKSLDEIHTILALTDRQSLPALAGSERWLTRPEDSVVSAARDDLITRARSRDEASPLYVIAIGACTNVAAALTAAPDIRDKIVVLWLGGQPLHSALAHEFNLAGDAVATRCLLDSGVPLILFPCRQVAQLLQTTLAELERHLEPTGTIGRYLTGIFRDYEGYDLTAAGAAKVIWDIAPVAWLLDQAWITTALTTSPVLAEDWTWQRPPERHHIRIAEQVERNAIFADLFNRIAQADERESG